MPQKIRCAIYDRVSTDLQVEKGLSLDTQKELLTEYALSHGYEIVDYYVDEGLTARKKLQNRKDFQRLLNDVQKDKIDLILVTKLDRWFRNVRDYHNTQAILEAHNCNWKTILEDYDTSTADGQLKINIMLAVAQNESDRTSERIKVVFEHKRRMGQHINGRINYGYMVVDKKPQKNPEHKEIVEDFFRVYFATFSKRKAINYILDHYENPPSPQAMDRFTKKEIYCGRRGSDLNYCEPYITPEQFDLIQKVSASKTYHTSNERYIFSQLIKCPYCGATMTGFVKKHTCKDGTVTRHKRYRCSNKFNKHARGACLTESKIEKYLTDYISAIIQNKLYSFEASKKNEKRIDQTDTIRAEMERLNNIFIKGRISEFDYDRKYAILEAKLGEEQRLQSESVTDYKSLEKLFSGNWLDIYNKLDAEHKNAFWKKIIKEIVIDRETHTVSDVIFHHDNQDLSF